MNRNESIENIKLEIKYLIENSAFFKVSDVIDLQDGYIIEDICCLMLYLLLNWIARKTGRKI